MVISHPFQYPSFHVSVLWTLGDVREIASNTGFLDRAQKIFDNYFEKYKSCKFLNVHEITLKMGNKVYKLKV